MGAPRGPGPSGPQPINFASRNLDFTNKINTILYMFLISHLFVFVFIVFISLFVVLLSWSVCPWFLNFCRLDFGTHQARPRLAFDIHVNTIKTYIKKWSHMSRTMTDVPNNYRWSCWYSFVWRVAVFPFQQHNIKTIINFIMMEPRNVKNNSDMSFFIFDMVKSRCQCIWISVEHVCSCFIFVDHFHFSGELYDFISHPSHHLTTAR